MNQHEKAVMQAAQDFLEAETSELFPILEYDTLIKATRSREEHEHPLLTVTVPRLSREHCFRVGGVLHRSCEKCGQPNFKHYIDLDSSGLRCPTLEET